MTVSQTAAKSEVTGVPIAEPRASYITSTRLWMVAAVGVTVGALVLRLHGLSSESLWLDEGYTLLFSGLPLDRLFVVGGAHEHPPLYYLIVHAVLSVHRSWLVPRAVAAVAGALSVLVVYGIGAELFGRFAGFASAALLALSPFHLWYSQDGRAYELAGLFVLLSYLCVFRALRRSGALLWTAYALVTALALYTEYTTGLALLPQTVLALRAHREGHLRPLFRAWLGTAIAFAPWVGTLALDARSIAGNYWIPAPTPDSVVVTALQFIGLRTPCPSPPCQGSEATLPLLAGHDALVAAVAILVAIGVLGGAVLRRNVTVSVLALWLLLPFALVLVISLKRPIYLDRVFLDATFPLYLLVGAAAARPRAAGGAGRALWLALCLGAALNVRLVYANPTNPDWKTAVRDLQAAYRPGQTVIFNPGVLQPLVNSYLPPNRLATRQVPMWSAAYLDVPAWGQRYSALRRKILSDPRMALQEGYARLNAILRNDQLQSATDGQRSVWMVTQDYSGMNDSRAWLRSHGFHLLLSEIYSGDTRIELWSRGGPDEIGPAVVPDDGFRGSWERRGNVQVRAGVALERGNASLSRSFAVRGGQVYSVNVEYQATLPAYPIVAVDTFDRSGRETGSLIDRYGNLDLGFPRTEWYSMPADGAWLGEPFGFVVPPGSVRATIEARTFWGGTSWRHIAVYRER